MASWCRYLLLVVLLAQVMGSVRAARILGVCPFPSKSHYFVINSLLKELAVRGHEVTVISTMHLEKPLPNYTNIEVEFDFQKFSGGKSNTFEIAKNTPFAIVLHLLQMGDVVSENTLANKKVQELIKSRQNQFDLIILEDFANEAIAGLAHRFKAPLIYFHTAVGTVWTYDLVGNPICSSYVPSIFLSYTDHMTFIERLLNTIHNLFTQLYYHLFYIPRQDVIMKKHFQGIVGLPHLTEINAKTSLVLTNAVPGINYPQPLLPNIIQVGGIHIVPPEPLPQDLQTFLDNAPEGVIYFSMGSFLKSADFPVQIKESFLKAFAKLKQKVLWKFEMNDIQGLPSNVVVRNWFPQNDILAHRNVKLFITHGGLLSSQEAVYHGVPLIGIPFLGDQRLNMRSAEHRGYGIILEMSNITETSLEWALNEALGNPRFTERVKVVSRIFRDQPQTPMEKAVFWTEYVLRHKGASHLRSAAMDLTWYQYLLLDVIAVLLFVVLTVISIIVFSCKKLFGGKKSKAVRPEKKRN